MADRSEANQAIRKLADDARRHQAALVHSDAALAGCLASSAVVLVIAFVALIAWRMWGINLTGWPDPATLFIAGALVIACLAAVLAFVLVRRTIYAVDSARNAKLLERFTAHFRKVLYDQGLLALVLGNDPVYSVPSIAQYLGLPPVQGQRGTAAAVSSFNERIELLLNYYGLLCKHYRIKPYPADNPFASRGVDPIRLRSLPRRAMVFALAEGIDGADADESQPEVEQPAEE